MKPTTYILLGTFWGLSMFLIMTPLITHRWWWEVNLPFTLMFLGLSMAGGMLVVLSTMLCTEKRGDPNLHLDMSDLTARHQGAEPEIGTTIDQDADRHRP